MISSSATQYYLRDHLSPRVTTDSSGNIIGQQGHFPYGEQWYAANTTSKYEFTSYERDSESENDYAKARYNINRLGRFASPDRVAGSTSDPQTFNRYSYVRNMPLSSVDPTGMFLCAFSKNQNMKQERVADGASRAEDDSSSDGSSSDELSQDNSCGDYFSIVPPDPGISGGGGGSGDSDASGYGLYDCNMAEPSGSVGFMRNCLYNPGGGAGNAGNGGGGGSATNKIAVAQAAAVTAILSDPACGSFFGATTDSAFAAAMLASTDIQVSDTFNEAPTSVPMTSDKDDAQEIPLSDWQPAFNGGVNFMKTTSLNAYVPEPGIGAPIMLNASGGFFVAGVVPPGAPIIGPQSVSVGPYGGGSLQAETAIILHEFAHDLGLIPDDSGNPGQSQQNTSTILQNCATALAGIPH
jgi:RHS repeat-associated protein